jgi:hypothetical protein
MWGFRSATSDYKDSVCPRRVTCGARIRNLPREYRTDGSVFPSRPTYVPLPDNLEIDSFTERRSEDLDDQKSTITAGTLLMAYEVVDRGIM